MKRMNVIRHLGLRRSFTPKAKLPHPIGSLVLTSGTGPLLRVTVDGHEEVDLAHR